MIVERVLEAKQAKIKQYPVHTNWASDLGHECVRYLVLNRTRWQEKVPHGPELQMIFDMGWQIERMCEADLREAGFAIIEQGRPFWWDAYKISGHIDMKIGLTYNMIDKALENGNLPADVQETLTRLISAKHYPVIVPAEIKSTTSNVMSSINTIEDMKNHKYHYMRKYPAQLTLYLLMDSKELGVFLFKNKQTGKLKEIWMKLDYEFAESLVAKAEAINKHVAESTLPEPIPYDERICDECPFRHICLPDTIGKEVQVPDDGELLELVTRYFELKPGAKEYEDVDKRITELVKGREKILVGDYFIEGKWQTRMGYEIPPEIKAQYQKPGQFWRKNIISVIKGGNSGNI